MSKDTIFNEGRKNQTRPPQRSFLGERHDFGFAPPPVAPFFRPLAEPLDYRFGYDEKKRKFVRGIIVNVIFAEKAWRYCVRPENQDAFWTKLIM